MSNILSKFFLSDLSNALRNGFHSAFSIVSAILNDGKLVIPCYCQKKKKKKRKKRKKRKKYEEKESENLSTSITVVLEQHKEQEEAIIVQK
jgi:hypothetical protein